MSLYIVSYLPGDATSASHGSFDIGTVPGDRITHLIYGFAGFKQQGGTWVADYPEPHDAGPGKHSNVAKLIELKKRWPDLRVMLSVGGWHHSHQGDPTNRTTPVFSAVAATTEARQAFVTSCVDTFIKPGHPQLGRLFDGIDIDWEYPAAADKHNFTLLLQEFRAQLDKAGFEDGRQLFLTVALDPGQDRGTLELASIASAVDWVNLMAYNAHGPSLSRWNLFTDFQAPLYKSPAEPVSNVTWNIDPSVQTLARAGLPAAKLVLGISAHGLSYAGVTDANHGLYQPYTGPGPGSFTERGKLIYRDIATRFMPSFELLWDDISKSSYLYSPSQQMWISFDDARSVATKCRYASKIGGAGLSGLVLWDISADLTSVQVQPRQSSLAPPLIDIIWGGQTVASNELPIKADIDARSNVAPALCSHRGQLFIAWAGTDSRINIMFSSDDGSTFGGRVAFAETSDAGPALASHNRMDVKTPPQYNLRTAWKEGQTQALNIARVALAASAAGGFGGIHDRLADKVPLPESSDAGPAMASLGGRLFLAWRSSGDGRLNLMFSSDDGATFTPAVTLSETTDGEPALAVNDGKLFVAWRNPSQTIAVAQVALSSDGSVISGLLAKTVIPEISGAAPALCSHNGQLFVAWPGSANAAKVSVMMSTDDAATFVNQVVLNVSTGRAVALASHNGNLFIAWKHPNNNGLSIGQIAFGTPQRESYPVTEIAAAKNQDGRLEAFGVDRHGTLLHIWQASPGGDWSGWAPLGQGYQIAQVATGQNQDGRLEAFGVDRHGTLLHIWQASPGGDWSGWAPLGQGYQIAQVATGQNHDGRLEAFGIDNAGTALDIAQASPNGTDGWSDWSTL